MATTKISPVEVQKTLGGIDFPANKQALIKHAKERGASGEIINAMNGLPNKDYLNSADVSSELGGDAGKEAGKDGDSDMDE